MKLWQLPLYRALIAVGPKWPRRLRRRFPVTVEARRLGPFPHLIYLALVLPTITVTVRLTPWFWAPLDADGVSGTEAFVARVRGRNVVCI